MSKDTFIRGAMILTIAGIIVKIIGAVNRILLSRLLGGEGIGLYQMAYPIYLLALSISSAGLPVAISIMVAEKNAIRDYIGAQRVFKISSLALTVTGFVFSLLLYVGAHWLVDTGLVRDPRAYWALVALSPAIFIVTIVSCLRGYFQGLQEMKPTAISQILEQLFRVVTMIAFAVLLLPYGLEYAAAGATFGAFPGALIALVALGIFYYRDRHERRRMLADQDTTLPRESLKTILKRLLVLALPVSLANIMLPVVANIDLFVVPHRLAVAGYSVEESTELFGYLTGMATSLVNLPTILTASLAASLVPAISAAYMVHDRAQIFRRTDVAMRIANILTIPSYVGLCVIATTISLMLYATPNAGSSIQIMSFGIFLLGVQQVTTGILQGMGRTAIPLINMVVSAVVKFVLNWTLTAIPALGIQGAAWATNADFGVAALLNLYFLHKYLDYRMDWQHTARIFAAAIGMGVFTYFGYTSLVTAVHSNTLATLGAIIIGMIVYTVGLILAKGISSKDVAMLPKIGPKLALLIARWEHR